MPITAYEKLDGKVSRALPLTDVGDDTIKRARAVFDDYKARSVILGSCFDDAAWSFTNQAHIVNISLVADGSDSIQGWLGCDIDDYRNCVRAYIVFNLGELELSTMRAIVSLFNKIPALPAGDAAGLMKDAHHAAKLLQLLPGGNERRDAVIAALDENASKYNRDRGSQQRALAEFHTYLKFNKIVDDFWSQADDQQRLFYFPLYFWWRLTAILPLRPTEFLLTPRDCLDGNTLAVRRTRLKGGVRKIGYRINDDYEVFRYTLNSGLADELRKYIDATHYLPDTEISTLFRLAPYCGRQASVAQGHNRYYTYQHLRNCLRAFYDEVVREREPNLEMVNLGDTRHLAMISLISSGGSPTICRELAGHADIGTSSHYYANFSKFVECVTINRFRASKGGEAGIAGNAKYTITRPAGAHRVDGGYCAALSVKGGDVSECLKVMDSSGRIGECSCCAHYYPDIQGLRMELHNTENGKEQVDLDSRNLIRMIELVRKGIGYSEDIGSALLRLQRSCDRYGKCLWEKYERGEIS